MTSIGETLRRERMRRNIDLEQISRELKISSRFLGAIEAEKFDQLPGGVFAKSFVRQYARFLDLDEDDFGTQMQRLMAPEPVMPAAAEPAAPAPPIHVPRLDHWESATERHFVWASWAPSAAMLVIAILACSGIYVWWQRQRAVATAQEPAASTAERVKAEPAPATPSPEPAAPTATPAPAEAQATPPAPTQNPGASVQVALTANEPVWVSAQADGKPLFSGTLAANETRTVEANETLLLRVGNAGGVTITLNGKPIGAIGPKGLVRTVQFTPGGFQIVASPKPALPLDPL